MDGNNFYFGSLRKLVSGVGTLFNNIVIEHDDDDSDEHDKLIKVPLSYAPREHYMSVLRDKNNGLYMTLPRMSYAMTDMTYDPTRKKITTNYNRHISADAGIQEFYQQLNPIPYNVGFQLNVMTRTIEDGLQIIEQITPYFTPDFNIVIKEMPELGLVRDVPVSLESVAFDDSYSGQVGDERILTWTLTFTCMSQIYPPMKLSKVILKTITTLKENADKDIETITHEVTPNTAKKDEAWTITETFTEG